GGGALLAPVAEAGGSARGPDPVGTVGEAADHELAAAAGGRRAEPGERETVGRCAAEDIGEGVDLDLGDRRALVVDDDARGRARGRRAWPWSSDRDRRSCWPRCRTRRGSAAWLARRRAARRHPCRRWSPGASCAPRSAASRR